MFRPAVFPTFATKLSMSRLNCNGKILDLSVPAIMGILNVTPDSFYDGGQYVSADAQLKRVELMLRQGASIIDIGAASTRPGAEEVCQTGELERLLPSVKAIRKQFPGAIISVDTFRPLVARAAIEQGADMINDIYGGRRDANMMDTVAELKVPYVIMHMKGEPGNMQDSPAYSDIIAEICYFFEKQLSQARAKGVRGLVIDPGFGFGKTIAHNYRLLDGLEALQSLETPVMVGLSRKSMIYRTLDTSAGEALNGSIVLQTIALMKGAAILRVHDVKEAAECVKLFEAMKKYTPDSKTHS